MANLASILRALALGALLATSLPAEPLGETLPSLPLELDESQWKPLDECRDPGFEAVLVQRLRADPRRRAMLDAGKLGVALADLRRPEATRYATANGDVMLYTASMSKLLALAGAEAALEDGSLSDSPAFQAQLGSMIRVSSNPAASAVIDRVGVARIVALVKSPAWSFYDREKGGGFWLGARYGSGGTRIPEPLRGLVHAGTAHQIARFFHLVAHGRLVTRARSAEMLGHMGKPGLPDGFVAALTAIAPEASLYRKSGRWKTWNSEGVLVWGPGGRRYLLVAVADAEGGERILRDLVGVAEATLGLPEGDSVRRDRFEALHQVVP